jgi:hypothetical protein
MKSLAPTFSPQYNLPINAGAIPQLEKIYHNFSQTLHEIPYAIPTSLWCRDSCLCFTYVGTEDHNTRVSNPLKATPCKWWPRGLNLACVAKPELRHFVLKAASLLPYKMSTALLDHTVKNTCQNSKEWQFIQQNQKVQYQLMHPPVTLERMQRLDESKG